MSVFTLSAPIRLPAQGAVGLNASTSYGSAAIPTLASLSGAGTTQINVATSYAVTLNAAAERSYTVTWLQTGSATIVPTTSVISIGQSSATASYTWPSGSSGTVDFTISPSLTRAGRPKTVTFAAPQASANQYRYATASLFQAVDLPIASTLGGGDWSHERWGPTYNYVDISTGWRWDNPGGDWIDSTLTRQGTSHWAQATVSAVGSVSCDATSLLQWIAATGCWCALRMWSTGDYVTIAGPLTPGGYAAPFIDVEYVDGTTDTLSCSLVARSTSGSSSPISTDQSPAGTAMLLPAFVEFERPTKAVSSAQITLYVVAKGSGSPVVAINLCDPPRNASERSDIGGLAALAGDLDAGITSVTNVIGAHRYVDGAVLSDFCAPLNAFNYNAEASYDPAIYGTGSTDTSKLPHAYLGKWIDSAQDENEWSVVDSSYGGDGFEPLAPGLGALRIVMPDTGVATGDEQGNGGTTAAARKIMLPEADYGNLQTIFVRYYIRIGVPHEPTTAQRVEVRRFGAPEWTAMAGKWGIAPEHVTTYGGFSGSSGGQYGWQLRHKWAECELSNGGPDEQALIGGWHLYDFGNNNPAGYRYQSESVADECWDAYGGNGLAGALYPGKWYCIEQEVKLNSVDAPSSAGDGLNWTPDGELRVWLNGRLAYERTGMVFRALPLYNPGYNSLYLRPIRQIGHKALLFNWFHGGLNNSTYQRVLFVTGLVWAKERIGAMNIPLPEWVPTTDNTAAALTTADYLANNMRDIIAPYYHEFAAVKANNDYSTHVLNPHLGQYGTILGFGGGHSATNYNAVWALELTHADVRFKQLTAPTPTYGTGTDSATRWSNSTHQLPPNLPTYGEPLYGETYMAGTQTDLDPLLRPVTNHSYDYLTVVGPESGGAPFGSLFLVGSISSTTLSNVSGTAGVVQYAAHRVDFGDEQLEPDGYVWRRDSNDYKSGIWSQAAPFWAETVPAQQRIYIQANVNHSPRWYDLVTKTYEQGTGTALTRNSNLVNSGKLFHVPERDLLVFAGPAAGATVSTALEIQYMSVGASDTDPSWHSATLDTSIAIPHQQGALSWQTACWCGDNERILIGAVYSDEGAIYEIEIPATLSGTWTCTRVVTGGDTIQWPHLRSDAYKGAFWMAKRWHYNPLAKCIVWVDKVGDYSGAGSDTVYVYRPRNV